MPLQSVEVPRYPLDQLGAVLGPERVDQLRGRAVDLVARMGRRQMIHVNSTARGGGVAEMLLTLLGYARGAGVDTRWEVVEGNPDFFRLTKRLHHNIYGQAGDGGPLGERERALYEAVCARNSAELVPTVRPGDVVVLHDPQTAGMVPALRAAGARVAWRCHIGADVVDEHSERGWGFLRPYIEDVERVVISKNSFAPRWMQWEQLCEIPPSLDPLSPKNAALTDGFVADVLARSGLLAGDGAPDGPLPFVRRDGTTGRMSRPADLLGTGSPPADVPLVVQVSRWDPLKGMAEVLEAFAARIAPGCDAELLLVGPSVEGVTDDPEGPQVLASCRELWAALPGDVRARVHLACLPMLDLDENALLVNALQRHAAVVTQLSLAEGFGLTVAEAMWKGRPVVASRIGGIELQIESGESGILVDDPTDLETFGREVRGLLDDPERSHALGASGRKRVDALFLPDRQLLQYADLIAALSDDA
jgi:trehalose synthase